MGHAMGECFLAICISVQSDQGFYCPHWILKIVLIESKCQNRSAYVQDDVNQQILCLQEGTFVLDTAQIMLLTSID